jgi:hypothetical protein
VASDGKKLKLEHDLGLCPCGQPIFASSEPAAVIHGIPYCEQFLKLEPDEFLTYVRRFRRISDSIDDLY